MKGAPFYAKLGVYLVQTNFLLLLTVWVYIFGEKKKIDHNCIIILVLTVYIKLLKGFYLFIHYLFAYLFIYFIYLFLYLIYLLIYSSFFFFFPLFFPSLKILLVMLSMFFFLTIYSSYDLFLQSDLIEEHLKFQYSEHKKQISPFVSLVIYSRKSRIPIRTDGNTGNSPETLHIYYANLKCYWRRQKIDRAIYTEAKRKHNT